MKWVWFSLITPFLFVLFVLVNALSPLSIILMIINHKYAKNVLVAYDQLGNAIFGGDPQETISSRLGKAAEKGNVVAKICSWYLNIPDPGHTKKAINPKEGSDGLV